MGGGWRERSAHLGDRELRDAPCGSIAPGSARPSVSSRRACPMRRTFRRARASGRRHRRAQPRLGLARGRSDRTRRPSQRDPGTASQDRHRGRRSGAPRYRSRFTRHRHHQQELAGRPSPTSPSTSSPRSAGACFCARSCAAGADASDAGTEDRSRRCPHARRREVQRRARRQQRLATSIVPPSRPIWW